MASASRTGRRGHERHWGSGGSSRCDGSSSRKRIWQSTAAGKALALMLDLLPDYPAQEEPDINGVETMLRRSRHDAVPPTRR